MVGSTHQGRDSIEKLVYEDEVPDLTQFSYMEGLGKGVIYDEENPDAWVDAEYTVNISENL